MITESEEETLSLARAFARRLNPGSVVALYGDLGAGKTVFVRGILSELQGEETPHVSSPTFTYLNIYEGDLPLYHFDLYRLNGPDDFFEKGFEEYLEGKGICCVEWPERLGDALPPHAHKLTLNHLGGEKREIVGL